MSQLLLPPHSDGVTLNLAELMQYQKQAIHWIPPAISIWSQLNGQHQSKRQGRGMNFSEVRPYQPGDDVRTIDWRVTARTGKTHTKLFSEEREQPVMLLVDLSQSMKFGSKLLLKSVQACHFASLLSWITIIQKDRIGAVFYTGNALHDSKPTARQQGALRMMDSLVKAHQEMHETQVENKGFQEALKHMHHLCPKGSDIVIISDFYSLTAQDKKVLSQLRQHNRIQFVRVSDPLEQGQTEFRGYEYVTDDKSSAWLNFSSKKTRENLAREYSKHQDFVQNLARSLAIPFNHLSAAESLITQLKKVAKTQIL